MGKEQISDELLEGCKRYLNELDRRKQIVDKKKAEEKKEEAHKAERRKYWAKLLYGKDSQGTTLILPEDSKLL